MLIRLDPVYGSIEQFVLSKNRFDNQETRGNFALLEVTAPYVTPKSRIKAHFDEDTYITQSTAV
jgi:hypothetical protein